MRSGDWLAPADFHYAVTADAFSVPGCAAAAEGAVSPTDRRYRCSSTGARPCTPCGARPRDAEILARAFWPGPLTLIGKPQLSLAWTAGVADAVALRYALHPWMLTLVAEVGLAGTGAQRPDEPAPGRALPRATTKGVDRASTAENCPADRYRPWWIAAGSRCCAKGHPAADITAALER